MENPLIANAATARRELDWFSAVVTARGAISFENNTQHPPISSIIPPATDGDSSPYAAVIRQHRMNAAERFVLILSLVPHLQPNLLDILLLKNEETGQPFTQLGGQKGNHGVQLPTGETAVFLLAGHDLEERFSLLHLFSDTHFFATHNLLKLQPVAVGEPRLSGLLVPSAECLTLITTGETFRPVFSGSFPARRIHTGMDWGDLVVAPEVAAALSEISQWLQHGSTLLHTWGFSKKIKPGYRVIFSGPPGTGKTLTAALLGKQAGIDVYQVDLSMIVSKYIGETEKNLSQVFDLAENKNWILFFDEADALFGKRTDTAHAHDRYANQEVSYLLQRIEDYSGLVILATNFKSNIDNAFLRRFQLIVDFQKPDEQQRLRLWQNAFSPPCQLAADVNLSKLAAEYSITGSAIINVLRFCCLQALSRDSKEVNEADIRQGVRKELQKEGKTVF